MAQTPTWQSAELIPSAAGSGVAIRATATSATGEIYAVGQFSGTVTFGSTALTSTGSSDLFVACWNAATRSWAWAQRAGGTGADQAWAVAVEGANVYVTGFYAGAASFGPHALTTTNTRAAFVAKLTSAAGAGSWTWVQSTAGTGSAQGQGVAVSGTSVYVGGYFSAVNAFGSTTLTSQGAQDGFVAKLTDAGAAGTWTWVQPVRGTASEFIEAIAASGASVYIAGNTGSLSVAFGNAAPVTRIDGSCFVAKLTDQGSAGAFAWTQFDGGRGPGQTVVRKLVANGANVYATGWSGNTVLQFGSLSFSAVSGETGFVVKLTDTGTAGAYAWLQPIVAGDYIQPVDLAVDGPNVYICGDFDDTAPLTVGSTTLVSTGDFDAYVAKLVDQGTSSTWAWVQSAGGPGSEVCHALALATNGTVYVAVNVEVSAAFGALSVATAPNRFSEAWASLAVGNPLSAVSAAMPAVAIYPNPARTTLHVTLSSRGIPARVSVTDAKGRVLDLPCQQGIADVSGLAPGLYVVSVSDGQRTYREKFVKD